MIGGEPPVQLMTRQRPFEIEALHQRASSIRQEYLLALLFNAFRNDVQAELVCEFKQALANGVVRRRWARSAARGFAGSAVAGARDCWVRPWALTPKPVWKPRQRDNGGSVNSMVDSR